MVVAGLLLAFGTTGLLAADASKEVTIHRQHVLRQMHEA